MSSRKDRNAIRFDGASRRWSPMTTIVCKCTLTVVLSLHKSLSRPRKQSTTNLFPDHSSSHICLRSKASLDDYKTLRLHDRAYGHCNVC
jgi:hypothetical protein